MSRNGQEILYEGWLTKSPPTKRFWRSRWRRRWFTLQNSGELPGQYLLTYYTDRNCRKLKGEIDLDHCEQVDTGLKFENSKMKFDHMFDIKTPTRTYYLAADTDQEMKEWVTVICNVCDLKPTMEDEEMRIAFNASTQPKTDSVSENVGHLDSPPVSPVSTNPYIPISECITGKSPCQGVQDFSTLLLQNIFRYNNDTYEMTHVEEDPRFYDCPRTHQPTKHIKNSEMYCNLRLEKVNSSPLQSPTDSESVFTDDDWSHNTLPVDSTRNLKPSDSSADVDAKKLSIDSGKSSDPPPRPPKSSHIIPPPNYFNIPLKNDATHTKSNSMSSDTPADEMYDFPRSHVESDSLKHTLSQRHCYNNAAPVNLVGQVFTYDVSPKPSTSTVFRYDQDDIQEEPASPVSQSSTSTAAHYSNLPSPLPSDLQLPPPVVNRGLKPKRKLSDSVSISSIPEPSSPHLAPTVDRKLKPPFQPKIDRNGDGRKIRAAPSPTPPDAHRSQGSLLSENEAVYQEFVFKNDGLDLDKLQYLDLDHSDSNFPSVTVQPPRSPGASTVYKKVDFTKTEAFNRMKQIVEQERKETFTSTFKK